MWRELVVRVVYVAEAPSSLAGMAGPIPELVQGVGTGSVEVFGLADGSEP